MSPDPQGDGETKKKVGRPKKKPSEFQQTHSIRATKKDWKEIQLAARLIKSCHSTTSRPRVLILSKEEYADIQNYLLQGFFDRWHGETKDEPPPPQSKPEPPTATTKMFPERVEHAETPDEEEAVSIFLEYFRLNPGDATSFVRSKLERETRIRAWKENQREQNRIMAELEGKTKEAIDAADKLNEQVRNMLKFPGYRMKV